MGIDRYRSSNRHRSPYEDLSIKQIGIDWRMKHRIDNAIGIDRTVPNYIDQAIATNWMYSTSSINPICIDRICRHPISETNSYRSCLNILFDIEIPIYDHVNFSEPISKSNRYRSGISKSDCTRDTYRYATHEAYRNSDMRFNRLSSVMCSIVQ